MPILFKCELCRARLSISRSKAGKIGTCPKCGEPIHIPKISDIQSKSSRKKSKPELAPVSSDSAVEAIKEIIERPYAPPDNFVSPRETQTQSEKPEPTSAVSDNDLDEPPVYELTADGPGQYGPVAQQFDASLPKESMSTTESDTESESVSVLNSILIPRWVIYFQAGLIGVVAATFFIFGMMVGSFTTSPERAVVSENQFRIGGSVFVDDEVDEGAVVIALPTKAKPDPRPQTTPLHPDSFEPVNNDSITIIRELGGDVVRTNRNGAFELIVEGPAEYFLLVVSKNKRRRSGADLEKQEMAQMGRFFLPYQPLIENKQFVWKKIRVTSNRNLKPINF